jgi:hypothetical protein
VRARVPFIGWPEQWVQPKYGFIWAVEQTPAIVSQACFEHASIEGVGQLHDVLDQIIAEGFFARNPGAVILHDWRMIKTIEPGAREEWNKRSARPGRPLQAAGISYLAVGTSSILRMAIQAGALAVQLATGQPPIRIIDDPSSALEAHNIHAPPRDSQRISIRPSRKP